MKNVLIIVTRLLVIFECMEPVRVGISLSSLVEQPLAQQI